MPLLRFLLADLRIGKRMRWKNQGARYLGVSQRKYKLCYSGNSYGTGFRKDGISMKEELCVRKCYRFVKKAIELMPMLSAFEEKVIRIVSARGPQAGGLLDKKHKF